MLHTGESPASADTTASPASPAPEDACCEVAGLKYVDDRGPGITRKPDGDGFAYYFPDGKRVRDPKEIARINALVIPPAYTDVWICPDPAGHIQATGRDARGRKQYRYHPSWHAVRDANKYEQLSAFALALPRIRRKVERDVRGPGMSHDRVVAVVVRLLETTLVRIGSPAYARDNGSYGLTTLRRRHTTVAGNRIRFRFKGKSGVEHDVTVNDRRIAAVVKRCMEITGHELFSYRDEDGKVRTVDSGAVNDYLREAGQADFTAKHYRTWAGSVLALAELRKRPWTSQTEAKRIVVEVVKGVARRLGNTPTVCRQCYIHPRIIEDYLAGTLPPLKAAPPTPRGLDAEERRLLQFLSSTPQESMGKPIPPRRAAARPARRQAAPAASA
ncbi:DNA topoisomerase IB [Bordetella genomosp. 9]|uniref:DNA topoisomerase n=1 Tax=Bordetella genomosp. 9 TaxID=1416803 RepID=A0A1W6Z464_9BORD|nr:DNA topoisomerase IB [Bordetella genomosp. 9]ARP88152.1 DNA topoisomerase [Bordetella genomosp. 9]ARP92115.1 DNA topoisomerase [Bordetella genomosp. 9]